MRAEEAAKPPLAQSQRKPAPSRIVDLSAKRGEGPVPALRDECCGNCKGRLRAGPVLKKAYCRLRSCFARSNSGLHLESYRVQPRFASDAVMEAARGRERIGNGLR